MMTNGTPSKDRIIADCTRVLNNTLQRIVDAKGCYIEDSANKSRHGVRAVAQQVEEDKKKTIMKANPEALKAFGDMLKAVTAHERPPLFVFDLTGDDGMVPGEIGDVVFVDGTDVEDFVETIPDEEVDMDE